MNPPPNPSLRAQRGDPDCHGLRPRNDEMVCHCEPKRCPRLNRRSMRPRNDEMVCHCEPKAKQSRLRGQPLQAFEVGQRLFAVLAAHLDRGLQSGTTGRTIVAAEDHATEIGAELGAANIRGLAVGHSRDGRGNGGGDAAGAAAGPTGGSAASSGHARSHVRSHVRSYVRSYVLW